MKRESILFYLAVNKLYLYFINSKKETIVELDTSLFFEFGEIKDIKKCQKEIMKILANTKIKNLYVKPNLIILFNDISHSDIVYLYKEVFKELEYNKIYFIPLSKIASEIAPKRDVVVFDKNYYTDFKNNYKLDEQAEFSDDTIFIGLVSDKNLHFSNEFIIWETFKSHFTNGLEYVKMITGDD